MNGPGAEQLILIADDEPALLELFHLVLAPDYRVLTATNGEAAWARIQQHRPAVVLLDVNLPRRSGIEVAAAIRAEPAVATATILLMTGLNDEAAREAADSTGADGYLLKPLRVQELVDAVERAFRTASLRSRIAPRRPSGVAHARGAAR